MIDSYSSIKEGVFTLEIKRSEFIAYSFPIDDENDAVKKLAAIRKKHYDARHVCYAYVADADGMIARFSDDGEPGGTAGKPILDVIKKNGLKKSLIAVVRYFGGILLGAGGLTRAYSDSAAGVVKQFGVVTFTRKSLLSVKTDYSTYKKISAAIKNAGETVSVEYDSAVTAMLACDNAEKAKALLTEMTNGAADVKILGEKYFSLERK